MRPELLVCAPLRVESAALRGSGPRVVRTGYGRRRSARSATRLVGGDFDALAVAGLGGGLDPTLRAGDVVVGTGVFTGERTRPLCAPEPLARELRRSGLSVRLGTVVTTDHPVTGVERLALARTGALVVDMESGVLAPAAGERPCAVVRVVLDTPRQPLIGPGMPWRLVGALRRLRDTGAPLLRWSRTVAGPGSQDTVRSRWSKEVP
ncbi:4-hydroxy-3-methylbut-2-enyl diphosphate reductase [Actinopolyspora biskrensis]|uniref:4-hydroxy-3-methylbut-2-enyl diphosphate reductase n=1 Tax=Actinopolyspora biskrensis TaxID=1470178 RepID=A0A852Z4M1_9ACTN|nr:hypothetical protein [Actinopolyspora biskrensis]NYH80962.1 4-hydroxy-3-methylbut-2-enyl diphosphate reductase [Actinopolyspora biskrensis]